MIVYFEHIKEKKQNKGKKLHKNLSNLLLKRIVYFLTYPFLCPYQILAFANIKPNQKLNCKSLYLPYCVTDCMYENHSCIHLVKLLLYIDVVHCATAVYSPYLISQSGIIGIVSSSVAQLYFCCHGRCISVNQLIIVDVFSDYT